MPIGETPSNVLGVGAFMCVRKLLSADREPRRLWMFVLVEFDIEVVSMVGVAKAQPRRESVRFGDVSDRL
jgi:hypothetical protein